MRPRVGSAEPVFQGAPEQRQKAEGGMQKCFVVMERKKVVLPGVTRCYRVRHASGGVHPAVCDRRQPRTFFGLIRFDSV
jgi:hypothetical protein